eukprot:jgi/Tetstr1/423888/TSEL_014511.t1
MPAFGQRLEAVVHGMEAVDDGHRFRLAYLRKPWDMQMHNDDDTYFTLHGVGERYLCHGTKNAATAIKMAAAATATTLRPRPAREALSPRAAFAKDTIKDAGKADAKAETSVVDKQGRMMGCSVVPTPRIDV